MINGNLICCRKSFSSYSSDGLLVTVSGKKNQSNFLMWLKVTRWWLDYYGRCSSTILENFLSDTLKAWPALLSSLAYGLPKYLLQKLQYVQNAAARLITGIRKHDHITPILMDLHWLPVNERIQFKILLLTFKSLNGLAPVYIDEMIQRYVPNRKLRSSSAFLLKQNKWNLKSYGFRTFTVAAPFLWNSLPLEVKSSPSLNIFKSKLKTHLFKCAFNLN